MLSPAEMYRKLVLVSVLISLLQYVSSSSKSCDCSCANLDQALLNDPVLQAKIQKMVKELKVDSKNTTAHLRSLKSAEDDRPSAQAAGFVGVVILSLVLGLMLINDSSVFYRLLRGKDTSIEENT